MPESPSVGHTPSTDSRIDADLTGLNVLILRSPERASELVNLIAGAGGHSVVAPIISRAEISDEARLALDNHCAKLAEFAWVGVTSVNAVDELVASIARTHPGRDISTVAQVTQWASVGPATTRALAAHGIEATFEAAENSAQGMLAQWPHPSAGPSGIVGKPPQVLLPLGDLATTQLEDGLAVLGYVPQRATTYRTVSHAAPISALDAWNDGDMDVVVLTSGSIVREFTKQFDQAQTPHHKPLMVAIGQPTTRAAGAAGLSIDVVATHATNRGLFDAIVRAVALTTEGN